MNRFTSGESIRVMHPLFQEEDDGSIPISPLQLNIQEFSLDKAIELNQLWHSRLPIVVKSNIYRAKHKIAFCAEYNGIYYAAAIWTDPIARLLNGKNWLELRRLAIANDAPKNTASRMIKIMIKQIKLKYQHIIKVISYQDCDVHTGTIYKASGWKEEAVNKSGDWIRKKRNRNQAQAPGLKIRWGRNI